MFEFEILVRGLYRQPDLRIAYQPDQRLLLPGEQQARLDLRWQEQLQQARQQQRLLFDAPLYRFIDVQAQPDNTLALTLGETSYKEYVTTREATFAHGRSRHELGNPLAVCSVIESSDGFILLDQRQGVDVYAGRYHVIGGFFERGLDTTAQQQPDPFAAMQREIREETGIQASDIQEQVCLGLVYDLATPHAELCFLTRLHIPLAEVLQRKAEDSEIKALQTLHVSATSLRHFLLQNHGNISATGEPNLLFYGALKFGESWLESTSSAMNELPCIK
ncbi:NUDIX hydrolase [Dictyobacter vulcani]|nr:NUDIX hydrolase [Dictyobacter vulcani]